MGTRAKKTPTDEVDRAVAAARRAIGRLAALLGEEEWPAVGKAALALERLGPFAVAPLAAALPRARSPRHRLAIAGVLMGFAHHDRGEVAKAPDAAVRREKAPEVRARLAAARSHVLAGGVAAMPGAQRK